MGTATSAQLYVSGMGVKYVALHFYDIDYDI
jgi:hypothetical protein